MADVLSMDQVLIEKLTKILEENLDKEHFGVKELAQKAGLSRSQLHRKLKYLTNKSPSRYIREFRLEKGMEMLQNNSATASEIAYRVGFSSPTYFNTCFHDYYGYPPGEVKFREPKVQGDINESENLELIDESKLIEESSPVKKHPLRHRMVWVNTVIIVLLSVISYNLYQNYKDTPAKGLTFTDEQDKSIAILPFKNLSEDAENQYFADGVSGSILNKLNSISYLKVIPSSSMEKYRNTTLTALEIAQEVHVIYLLEGSVQKYGDSIRVITNLVNARNNTQLQSFVFDWEYKHIFDIQTKIALDIAKQLDLYIAPENLETIQRHPTENIEAYNLYLKGRFFWHRRTKEGIYKSIDYFNQAIALDSTYTLAYAGLADSYYVIPWYIAGINRDSVFNIAKDYGKKALSLDKNNAQAHATLGAILCFKDWNWEASEKELKLAIQLNPNYATAHQWYAQLLDVLARNKEAREQIHKALTLNPNSYLMNDISAMLNVKAGNFEMASIDAQRAKEIDKTDNWSYWILFESYRNQGKDEEAITEIEEWWNLEPNIEMAKGSREAYNRAGIKGVYKYLIDYDLKTGNAINQPILMAQKYSFLGEVETALDWLERAYERRINGISGDLEIVQIKSDPYFKNLRDEPRFLALLKKMNLGGYE